MALDVSDLVRRRAMSNGVEGRRWLRDLPEVVASLCERWGLEVERSLAGGTASFVAAPIDRPDRACRSRSRGAGTRRGSECVPHARCRHDAAEPIDVRQPPFAIGQHDGQGLQHLAGRAGERDEVGGDPTVATAVSAFVCVGASSSAVVGGTGVTTGVIVPSGRRSTRVGCLVRSLGEPTGDPVARFAATR